MATSQSALIIADIAMIEAERACLRPDLVVRDFIFA